MQAFRVAAASSTTALSGVGIVSMLITVSDVNDNDPSFLNPTSTISVLEVMSLSLSSLSPQPFPPLKSIPIF